MANAPDLPMIPTPEILANHQRLYEFAKRRFDGDILWNVSMVIDQLRKDEEFQNEHIDWMMQHEVAEDQFRLEYDEHDEEFGQYGVITVHRITGFGDGDHEDEPEFTISQHEADISTEDMLGMEDIDNIHEYLSEHWDAYEDTFILLQEGDDVEQGEPIEVLEWWLVSRWMAELLAECGGVTGEALNMHLWGRSTSGQAWAMDGIIHQACQRMHDRYHEAVSE